MSHPNIYTLDVFKAHTDEITLIKYVVQKKRMTLILYLTAWTESRKELLNVKWFFIYYNNANYSRGYISIIKW